MSGILLSISKEIMYFCVFYCVSKSTNNVCKESLETVWTVVENLTLQVNSR
jgi:hypothetical protein